MTTPTANTMSPQDIPEWFKVYGNQIRALQAKSSLDQIDAQSLSHYAQQCSQNVLLEQSRKTALAKEVPLAIGSTVNVAMKTLLLVAAKQAARKKVAQTLEKELAKHVTMEIAEQTAKKAGEKASEKFLRIVPFVGIVFGVSLAVGRGLKGEHWTLVVGELVSGGASCFPGMGTVISLGIDASLLAADVYRATTIANSNAPTPVFDAVINNLGEAYGCIGIEFVTGGDDPSRADVDHSYRTVVAQYHPDKARDQSNEVQERFARFTVLINRAKELIYKHRHW